MKQYYFLDIVGCNFPAQTDFVEIFKIINVFMYHIVLLSKLMFSENVKVITVMFLYYSMLINHNMYMVW